MKATNSLTTSKANKVGFSNVISSDAMQNMIRKALGDPSRAARLTSTLISTVSASEQLKACRPETIVASALRGEGMGLTVGSGFYLVPYGDTCTFIPGYKGYIQLALATGLYADIDCIDVRQGEYIGRNRRTGKPDFNFNYYATDEEREAAPICGYYAYFELKDGMFRGDYWSMEKLLTHADKYSAAFNLDKYNAYTNGEMNESDMRRVEKSSPWYDVTGGQEKMCKKTVLRDLLNSGYAPLSNAVDYLSASDAVDGSVAAVDENSFFDSTTATLATPEAIEAAPETVTISRETLDAVAKPIAINPDEGFFE